MWLDLLCLPEYKDIFIRHDVRGAELVHLERRDLKVSACGVWGIRSVVGRALSLSVFQDLGVTKVGHMKRILQGIKDLSRTSSASEA